MSEQKHFIKSEPYQQEAYHTPLSPYVLARRPFSVIHGKIRVTDQKYHKMPQVHQQAHEAEHCLTPHLRVDPCHGCNCLVKKREYFNPFSHEGNVIMSFDRKVLEGPMLIT
jgi:hypothetical protein